jgi:predicted RNA-binding protein with PIN domain
MKDLLIVDGYNIIYDWAPLKKLAKESLEHARDKLIDTLAGYGKSKGYLLLIVFDAMYTDESAKSIKIGRDCKIIFTDKEETADSCIERIVYEHRQDRRNIYVATSDGPEQNQILGAGAYRIPARELAEDVRRVRKELSTYAHTNVLKHNDTRNEVVYRVRNEDVLAKLEKIRRSK